MHLLLASCMGCVKQVGDGLEGSRGGRVVWTCNDQFLAVTGFDKLVVWLSHSSVFALSADITFDCCDCLCLCRML